MMKTYNRLLVVLLTFFFVCGNIFAQSSSLESVKYNDNAYTLNQKQETNLLVRSSVLKKIDANTTKPKPMVRKYKGAFPEYNSVSSPKTAIPTIEIDTTHSLNIKDGLCLKGKQAEFAGDLSFLLLNQKGQNLFIDYGIDIAKRNNIAQSPHAYALSVNKQGISIIGYDEAGTRKGIDILKNMLSSPIVKGSDFPYVRITGD